MGMINHDPDAPEEIYDESEEIYDDSEAPFMMTPGDSIPEGAEHLLDEAPPMIDAEQFRPVAHTRPQEAIATRKAKRMEAARGLSTIECHEGAKQLYESHELLVDLARRLDGVRPQGRADAERFRARRVAPACGLGGRWSAACFASFGMHDLCDLDELEQLNAPMTAAEMAAETALRG